MFWRAECSSGLLGSDGVTLTKLLEIYNNKNIFFENNKVVYIMYN